jgi:hypothetical protein
MAQRRRGDSVNDDLLETQEFYEMCQRYRHAQDAVRLHPELPTAAEAFEDLKAWIRGSFKQRPAMPYDRKESEPTVLQSPFAHLYRDAYGKLKLAEIYPPPEGSEPVYLHPFKAREQPSLSEIDDLAKVYAASYASPHHITFTVEGLRSLIADAIR